MLLLNQSRRRFWRTFRVGPLYRSLIWFGDFCVVERALPFTRRPPAPWPRMAVASQALEGRTNQRRGDTRVYGKSLGQHFSLGHVLGSWVPACTSSWILFVLTISLRQFWQMDVGLGGLTGRPLALTGARVPAFSAALCSRAICGGTGGG